MTNANAVSQHTFTVTIEVRDDTGWVCVDGPHGRASTGTKDTSPESLAAEVGALMVNELRWSIIKSSDKLLIAVPRTNSERAHNSGVIDAGDDNYRPPVDSLIAAYHRGWRNVRPLPEDARA